MKWEEPRSAADYVGHILQAIDLIQDYTKGLVEQGFLESRITQDAVIRNFEIVGEASRQLLQKFPEFVASHPELPVVAAYGMRNALSHGYFTVDLEVVWKTVREDLPVLRRQIEDILTKWHDRSLTGGPTGGGSEKSERGLTMEAQRQKSVQNWLNFREAQRDGGEEARSTDQNESQREKAPRGRDRGLDDDL